MLNELALFAGAGGGILGGSLCGFHTIAACEIEEYPRRVLLARQRDGMLPAFPIWDDVRTFDGRPWRGVVDVVSGGFPCQDISSAGRGVGIAGSRSGLWFEMLRIIGEVRPSFVFAENSPHLRTRGLGVVIEGLAGLGYDVRWCVLGAWHAGAPHKRDRMWVYARLADAHEMPAAKRGQCQAAASEMLGRGVELGRGKGYVGREGRALGAGNRSCAVPSADQKEPQGRAGQNWWTSEPAVGRVAYGVDSRMDRLKALGNGQVPAVAAIAWQILHGADQ